MTTRPTPVRAVLASGVATTLYYATPDVVGSRTARGWLKAGITTISLLAAAPELRAAWTEARTHLRSGAGGPGDAVDRAALPAWGRAVLLGTGAAALALSVRGVVAAERRAFRYGEARAAAGKRLPHTGPALLYGALSAGLWSLSPPSSTDAVEP